MITLKNVSTYGFLQQEEQFAKNGFSNKTHTKLFKENELYDWESVLLFFRMHPDLLDKSILRSLTAAKKFIDSFNKEEREVLMYDVDLSHAQIDKQNSGAILPYTPPLNIYQAKGPFHFRNLSILETKHLMSKVTTSGENALASVSRLKESSMRRTIKCISLYDGQIDRLLSSTPNSEDYPNLLLKDWNAKQDIIDANLETIINAFVALGENYIWGQMFSGHKERILKTCLQPASQVDYEIRAQILSMIALFTTKEELQDTDNLKRTLSRFTTTN